MRAWARCRDYFIQIPSFDNSAEGQLEAASYHRAMDISIQFELRQALLIHLHASLQFHQLAQSIQPRSVLQTSQS